MTNKVLRMVLVLLLLPMAAQAQQKGNIDLKSSAEVDVVTKNAKGEKEVMRVDAAKAKVVPGDTVIFTTKYMNMGKDPASSVAITNPIPEHVLYVDRSVEGKGALIEFSIDKGKNYASPDKLTVTDAAGKIRPAGPADYTTIRWVLSKPLAPGGKGSVSFKGRVK